MKRFALAVGAIVVMLVGPLFAAAPAVAGTDDFTISSFDADYYLDVDDADRSTLRTVETIVAQFPDYDQNHGIIRYLVDDYNGLPTNISVESVTDGNGRSLSYESESDGEFLSLKIGDADTYVRGSHTYVITYTQHNVTLFDSASEVQEFYWDTNGTGWPQPFGSVTARVHVSAALAEHLNGNTRCYIGSYGSSAECTAPVAQPADDGVVFEVSANDLAPYENVTVDIGFDPGTFQPRDNSPWASPMFLIELFAAAVSVIIAVWVIVRRATSLADAPGRPTIVAEYLPPKNASPLIAGLVTKRKRKAVAAQLVSFAVNHVIRIIEAPATGFFAFGTEYTLELVDASGLDSEERWLAEIFFGSSLTPGAQYTIRKNDTVVGRAVYQLVHGLEGDTDSRGWHKQVSIGKRFLPGLLATLAGVLTVAMFIVLVDDARAGGWIPFIAVLVAGISWLVVVAVSSQKPYTAKGAELRDHLKGLELYIRVAETERIRMLQSPEGAERTPVDTTDRGQMLKLYERVLPFAVLFDQEKHWAKLLGEFYGDNPPDWYSGSSAFNSLAFASSISSIASTSSTAFSGSSSSSGGSSGGGSSGGGGGGGGGGGW
jgi:uncharacterized membrane protein YgcG